MAQKDESVQYLIELICEELNITEIVPLKLPCVPSSFDDIRNAIEISFSVPAFLQTLWVDGAKIDRQSSSGTPSQCYLQAGDTIKVSFPMKCECEKVKKVTKWLSECLDIIHSFKAAASEEEEKELFYKNSSRICHDDNILCLVDDLFVPWDDKMKETNAWYFDHLGGITSLVQIHKDIRSLVKKAKLTSLQDYGHYFERITCLAFTNFVADSALRRRATEECVLDCVLKSLLEETVDNNESKLVVEVSLMPICK